MSKKSLVKKLVSLSLVSVVAASSATSALAACKSSGGLAIIKPQILGKTDKETEEFYKNWFKIDF